MGGLTGQAGGQGRRAGGWADGRVGKCTVHSTAWDGTVQYGVGQYCAARRGAVRCNTVRYSTVRDGMGWDTGWGAMKCDGKDGTERDAGSLGVVAVTGGILGER